MPITTQPQSGGAKRGTRNSARRCLIPLPANNASRPTEIAQAAREIRIALLTHVHAKQYGRLEFPRFDIALTRPRFIQITFVVPAKPLGARRYARHYCETRM